MQNPLSYYGEVIIFFNLCQFQDLIVPNLQSRRLGGICEVAHRARQIVGHFLGAAIGYEATNRRAETSGYFGLK